MCDATPYPTETEPGALLATWSVVVAARQKILDEGKVTIGPELAPLFAELELRQGTWCAALAAARNELAQQRLGIVQVRRYQRVLRAADL
ncbi:MAG TPA: hypothetical protein VFQ65_25985 [Kofleriaceae bacterium]|nr:hypothetical protein [Kofleriaceae bacterium]